MTLSMKQGALALGLGIYLGLLARLLGLGA